MPPLKYRFDCLEIWHQARKLTAEVYAVTDAAEYGRDWALREMTRRAALQIMETVAELALPGAPLLRDHRALTTRAALARLQSLLYAAQDQGYVNADTRERMQLRMAGLDARLAGEAQGEAGRAAEPDGSWWD